MWFILWYYQYQDYIASDYETNESEKILDEAGLAAWPNCSTIPAFACRDCGKPPKKKPESEWPLYRPRNKPNTSRIQVWSVTTIHKLARHQ
jgi:hypothetical protein